jgi:hypothetical protein
MHEDENKRLTKMSLKLNASGKPAQDPQDHQDRTTPTPRYQLAQAANFFSVRARLGVS